jgi:nucleoside-diphosphate-sugar epimerase
MDKKILVIGGTQMVGRDFVEFCLDNKFDYEIHIANRGITNPNLFPSIKHISIDRNIKSSCIVLSQNSYDFVIDFSCYNIQQLLNIIEYINTKKYFIMSTLSVLDSSALAQVDHWLHKYASDKKSLEDYILNNNLPLNIIRTGALYGKNDYTNRYYELNNKFYNRQDNTEIFENKYLMNVRTFTKYLYQYISIQNIKSQNIIQIDLDGITKIL